MYLASRIILWVCGLLTLVASFLTWYRGKTDGRTTTVESAWAGAESVSAVIILILLAGLGVLGLTVRGTRLWLAIAEIVGAIVAFVLILMFASYNSDVHVIRGRRIVSEVGPGVWIGLVAAVGVTVAGVLGLIGALLNRPRGVRNEADWD